MNFDSILVSYMNGEPLHDAIIIGIAFIFFYELYKVFFSAVFSFFKR